MERLGAASGVNMAHIRQSRPDYGLIRQSRPDTRQSRPDSGTYKTVKAKFWPSRQACERLAEGSRAVERLGAASGANEPNVS